LPQINNIYSSSKIVQVITLKQIFRFFKTKINFTAGFYSKPSILSDKYHSETQKTCIFARFDDFLSNKSKYDKIKFSFGDIF